MNKRIKNDTCINILMAKLDGTDLKILAKLDLNARTTAADIGRSLDMTKSSVLNNINNLEDKGIIQKYVSIINFFKLDYLSHRISMKFQHVNRKIEDEMLEYLKNSHLSWLCSRTRGKYDVICLFWSLNHQQLSDFWNDFLTKYRGYIKIADVVPHYFVTCAPLPFTKHQYKEAKEADLQINGRIEIDQTDRMILKIISSNARTPLANIGEVVGLSPNAIKYRMDNLIEKKVILGFKPFIDMKKLGYSTYKVDLNLNSFNNRLKIENYIRENPNTYSMIGTIGGSDIQIKAFSKKTDQLYEMLDGISDEFPDDILDHEFLEYPKTVKHNTMPDF
jgi:Lrp/AsnC family transcriptional regulator for asnA, asnC and gidA